MKVWGERIIIFLPLDSEGLVKGSQKKEKVYHEAKKCNYMLCLLLMLTESVTIATVQFIVHHFPAPFLIFWFNASLLPDFDH